MLAIVLGFITAFLFTYLAIPSVIRIAVLKNLFDEPGERGSHESNIPTLGGVAIFAGILFSIVLWTPVTIFGDIQYILSAAIILFLIGLKDDIEPIDPKKKLIGQILASTILVVKSNVIITSLYGILGIYELPYWFSVVLSIFTIMVIINSFNLIDGINGLAGSIGVLMSITFGTWFFLVGHIELAIMGFALAGSLMAFLRFNITPAKIFMGDTGALLIGMCTSIMAIKFIELNSEIGTNAWAFKSAPAVAIGILIFPLFDTLRVFCLRIIKGRSPMSADRQHIHHLLLDCGLSHMRATSILIACNLFFILLVVQLQNLGSFNLLMVLFVIAFVMVFFLKRVATGKIVFSASNFRKPIL